VFLYKIAASHETGNNLNDPFYYEWSYSYMTKYRLLGSRHCLVCVAVRGSNSDVGKKFFSIPVQTGLGAHPISSTIGIGALPRGKAAGIGVEQPPINSAEFSYVLLYLYCRSVPIMVCYRALEEQGLLSEFWPLCIL
jgi:hypothetical protein